VKCEIKMTPGVKLYDLGWGWDWGWGGRAACSLPAAGCYAAAALLAWLVQEAATAAAGADTADNCAVLCCAERVCCAASGSGSPDDTCGALAVLHPPLVWETADMSTADSGSLLRRRGGSQSDRAKQRHEQARLRREHARKKTSASADSSKQQPQVKSPLAMLCDALGLSTMTEGQQNLLVAVLSAPFVAVILYRWRQQGVI
jgi:hypothetical protein